MLIHLQNVPNNLRKLPKFIHGGLLCLSAIAGFLFMTQSLHAQDYDLSFEEVSVEAGDSFVFPFMGQWADDVKGFTLVVEFTPNPGLQNLSMTINDTLAGELVPDFTHFNIFDATGEIRIGLLFEAAPPFTNSSLPPLPFPISMINFVGDVAAGTPATDINFQYVNGIGQPPLNNVFVDYDTLSSIPATGLGSGVLQITDPIIIPPDPIFTRGDINQDGQIDIADPLFVLNFSFLNGETPPCQDAADVNDDGFNDISDAVYILLYLFNGGAAPAFPFFTPGEDLTLDALGCETPPSI